MSRELAVLSIRVFVLRRVLLLLREERHGLAIRSNSLQDVIDEYDYAQAWEVTLVASKGL